MEMSFPSLNPWNLRNNPKKVLPSFPSSTKLNRQIPIKTFPTNQPFYPPFQNLVSTKLKPPEV